MDCIFLMNVLCDQMLYNKSRHNKQCNHHSLSASLFGCSLIELQAWDICVGLYACPIEDTSNFERPRLYIICRCLASIAEV